MRGRNSPGPERRHHSKEKAWGLRPQAFFCALRLHGLALCLVVPILKKSIDPPKVTQTLNNYNNVESNVIEL